MRVRLDLDRETTDRLIPAAIAERRPVAMHAEVLLRRALGLPDPAPLTAATAAPRREAVADAH